MIANELHECQITQRHTTNTRIGENKTRVQALLSRAGEHSSRSGPAPLWGAWLVELGASRGPIGYGRRPLSLYRAIPFTAILWSWWSPSKPPLAANAATAGKVEPASGFELDLRNLSTCKLTAAWKALEMKNSVHQKSFTEVSGEVVVLDETGFLSNSMMINATNTLVLERIWINRVAGNLFFSLSSTLASESWFQPLHPTTFSNSTSKITLMECGHPWKSSCYCLEEFSGGDITVANKTENTVQHDIVGLPLKCHQGRWPRSCGWHVETGFASLGPHAEFSGSDMYIERKLSSRTTHSTFTLRRNSGRLLLVSYDFLSTRWS